ncbi:MAG: hypothetical protein FWG96_03435 [Methanomassiliicoccaceae archaeon]|nr:hypothetical protein [Methanomassiliicoccaceae archaeon]
MNAKWLMGLSVFIIAFVLVGQVVAYWVNPHHYSADAEVTGGEIVFTVSAPSSDYSVLAYDNKGFESVTVLYVFMDDGYSGGQSMSDVRTFLGQLKRELDIRGFSDIIEVDAAELSDLMSESGSGKGILMLTGAFPDTVYSGNAADPVFTWLDNMGSIFWLNGKIGHFVSHGDGTKTKLEGTDVLFFGTDGAVRASDSDPIGKERGADRTIGEMLYVNTGVRAGDVTNGLNRSIGGNTLSIGFSDGDGYGSTTLTDRGEGKGMIAVFGGGLIADVRVTAAQVIASGISYNVDADEIVFLTGGLNGTHHGTIGPVDDFTDVYIFIGKLNTVYGKLSRFGA